MRKSRELLEEGVSTEGMDELEERWSFVERMLGIRLTMQRVFLITRALAESDNIVAGFRLESLCL